MKCYVLSSRLRENFESLALDIVVDRFLAMYHNDGEKQDNKREEKKEEE